MRSLLRISLAIVVTLFVVSIPTSPAFADDCKYSPTLKHGGDFPGEPEAMKLMDPQRVWPMSRGKGVKIAVIDSGVSDRSDVMGDGKVTSLKNLTHEHGDATCDQNGHGTVVGAIISAREAKKEKLPYYGMAPDSTLMSVKILRDTEQMSDGKVVAGLIADGINASIDAGADIINISAAAPNTAELKAAVKRAQKKDVLLVVAAGNKDQNGNQGAEYPAAYASKHKTYPALLAVSSATPDNVVSNKSNIGPYVDIAGPGFKPVGPNPNGDGTWVGADTRDDNAFTSFATPYVTGTAALVKARYPGMGGAEIATRITKTAEHPAGGRDEGVGYGMVDPYRAVTADLDPHDARKPGDVAGFSTGGDPQSMSRMIAALVAAFVVVLAIAIAVGRSVFPRARRRKRELAAGE